MVCPQSGYDQSACIMKCYFIVITPSTFHDPGFDVGALVGGVLGVLLFLIVAIVVTVIVIVIIIILRKRDGGEYFVG